MIVYWLIGFVGGLPSTVTPKAPFGRTPVVGIERLSDCPDTSWPYVTCLTSAGDDAVRHG